MSHISAEVTFESDKKESGAAQASQCLAEAALINNASSKHPQ